MGGLECSCVEGQQLQTGVGSRQHGWWFGAGRGVGEGEVGLSVPTSSTWVRVVASAESGSAEGTD